MLIVYAKSIFLHETEIPFKDFRYAKGPTWPPKNESLDLNVTGRLPILKIDDHKLAQVCYV
jgi:glutathione S-transferase